MVGTPGCLLRRSTTQTLPPELLSAPRARQLVRDYLLAYGLASDTVELAASELVANVVNHARTPVELTIIISHVVRIEVADGNAIIPAVVDAAVDAERGRGLAIVDALAVAWGVDSHPGGKYVWADFPREPAALTRVRAAPPD